jgi:hypothetical protein
MTGFADIQKIREFEHEANELGFKIVDPRHHAHEWNNQEDSNVYHISLAPLDNHHPTYTRGTKVFTGTLEEATRFLQGVNFAYKTDEMLRLSNNIKRGIAEAKEIERLRKQKEKMEQKRMWNILNNGIEVQF